MYVCAYVYTCTTKSAHLLPFIIRTYNCRGRYSTKTSNNRFFSIVIKKKKTVMVVNEVALSIA